ncbi:putative DNA-binding WGR domain protein [Rhodoblastus sphagnicola]|nr:putative DNA-binding WGR domain protein [Rhodoblastus sphagnicola]
MRWTAGGFAATFKPMNGPADHPLHLERIDATRNMWRYYELEVHPTLFGEHALVRSWVRIGAPGRRMIMTFSEPDAAKRAFKRLETAKRRRGYRDVQPNGAA